LDHTGRFDSHDGALATMTTCLGSLPLSGTKVLAQDDAAGAAFHGDSLIRDEFRNTTANAGFENGSSFWGLTHGALLPISAGGASGAGFGRWTPNQTVNNFLYSTTNVVHGDVLSVHARAIANLKKANASDTKYARVRLSAREVTYGTEGCGQYAIERDQNTRDSVAAYTVVADAPNLTLSDSWQLFETPSWELPDTWDGADMRVEVNSTLRDASGSFTSLDVDNSRVATHVTCLGCG
jgi:hypothetical protein